MGVIESVVIRRDQTVALKLSVRIKSLICYQWDEVHSKRSGDRVT